ncbi:MAG: DUF3480 domain-containing protein [Cyanobacteria bacterium REEB67]|nr:DUF3480 domain-containing protein [Cyanobacteria bacterium REEB67]
MRRADRLFYRILCTASATVALIAPLASPEPTLALPPPTPILPSNLDITHAAEAKLIATVEANSQVKVKIYRHKVAATKNQQEAWTYVTEGLAPLGQEEIVLTVLKRANDDDQDYPQLPIKLFDSISQLARQHKTVSAGGYTEFRTSGFLGIQFKGLLYAPVPTMLGVPLPSKCVAMVPITAEEMDVYQTAGASRLMARLGRQADFFPCPTWCDRDRQSAFSDAEIAEMTEDPVFRSAKAQTYSLTATQQNQSLSLRLTEKSAALLLELLKELPEDSALRLALGVDPRADALLVWESKANGNNSIIAPEGSKVKTISVTFLALLPGLPKNEILTGNDGCAVMITKDDFARFRTALMEKSAFSLPMSDDSALKSLSIDWAI